MKLLLVDDDNNKIEQISSFLKNEYPSFRLSVKMSFQSGLKEIVVNSPDIVLLDMTMPNYDVADREPGGRERRYAGREILRQMQRRGLQLPVIVVTQYEQFEEDGHLITLTELVASLHKLYPDFFKGAVFYQVANTEWMHELSNHLATIGNQQNEQA